MLISAKSVTKLADKIVKGEDVFCSGLFLSARWMVVSQLDHQGLQMIVLPDRDSAEYCASDLYSFIKEDNVLYRYILFSLPKSVKKSTNLLVSAFWSG